jgi:hypothetical protein
VGKKHNRSTSKKGKKKEGAPTRQVKAFIASSSTGLRQRDIDEQLTTKIEESLNKWIMVTGYVFDLCIHSMNTVVVGESMAMFVDYTVTPHEKSEKRMREVLHEKRGREYVIKGTEAEAEETEAEAEEVPEGDGEEES